MDDVELTERWACRATAQALRPSAARAIVARSGVREGGDRREIEVLLLQAMSTDALLARTGPWWSASGPGLTEALMHVTGVDQAAASYLLGAAMHAQILAGADLVQDVVLRLAERAVCWHLGSRYVLNEMNESLRRLQD